MGKKANGKGGFQVEQQGGGWAWFWNSVYDEHAARIGPYGLAVYVGLSRYASHDRRESFPSVARLARELGMSEPSVRKAMRSLVDVGLLHIERQQDERGVNKTNIYRLLQPGGGQPGLPGVGNQVDQGGQPGLPGVGNQVDPNKNKKNKTQENQTQVNKEGEPASMPARPAQPHVALIEAWWAAIPETVRPPGKAPIPRHVAAAKLMLADGFTPERITAFVSSTYPSYLSWAKDHDAPALMSLEHVKGHLKAWEAKKDAPARAHNRSSVTEHNREILERSLAKLQASKEKADGQS